MSFVQPVARAKKLSVSPEKQVSAKLAQLLPPAAAAKVATVVPDFGSLAQTGTPSVKPAGGALKMPMAFSTVRLMV